jgi:hypothetical protein
MEAFDLMLLSFGSSLEDKKIVSRRLEVVLCKLR